MIKLYLSMCRYLTVVFLLVGTLAFAQTRSVTGTVTSADDGSGIPGANILVKGTNSGTVTDANGNFSISASDNDVLVISFVGYATQEITVGSQSTINISLELDVTSLSEVVVIGYGQVQKKDLTGSVISVGEKSFNKGVMTSPQDMLVGKVAGVQVTTSGGAPGAGSQILIRGGASRSASNSPLIVVDGFPLDNNGISGTPNSLSTINPNDIENVTVLKDASATAIYGSRASNGVIIITTKKGKEGKPELVYDGQVSISTPIEQVDVLTGDEFRTLMSSLEGSYGINSAALAKLGNENTDWQDEIYRNAVSHNHNLSFSGTTNDIPYRVSYGFTDEQGILKTTSTQRHSLNFNVNPTFLDGNLNVKAIFKGSYAKNNFGDQGAIGSAVSFDPTQPVYNDNQRYGGYFTWVVDQSDIESDFLAIAPRNPVARLDLTNNQSNVYRAIGNLELDYRFPFLPELKANLNAGFDLSKSDGYNDVSTMAPWTSELGSLTDYTGERRSSVFDLYFNYIKEIAEHKFDVTAGYSYQSFQRDGTNFSRAADLSIYYDFDVDGDGNEIPREFIPEPNYLLSLFGRLNYSFRGKYLVTATLRNDYSSRFSEDVRAGYFPAVAVAWRISDEGFMGSISQISNFKFRAGWGITGQQDIGDLVGSYPYLPIFQTSTETAQYQFGNTFYTTYRPQAYAADIKWEETTTYNVGVDFGLFNDRLSGSVDWYRRESRDLLNTVPIAAGTNFNNFLTYNVGDLENNGIEVTLNADIIRTSDFSWNFGVNFSHNENKITKMTVTDDPNYQGASVGGISGAVGNTIQNDNVGFPRQSFFVFQQIYDTEGNPIEGLYVDRTGNGGSVVSDQLNKYHYRNPQPEFAFGFTQSFTYKDFDLFMAGRMNINNYVYNNGQANTFYQSAFNNNTVTFNNLRSSIFDTNFAAAQYWSDYYVQNASFFKMDNISLGYNMNDLLDGKLRARFSFTVRNAFIVTKYDGIDPEVGDGIDNNIYPRPRIFQFGVRLTY